MKKVLSLILISMLSFSLCFASSNENNQKGFNLFGSKEVFALSPVQDGILFGTGILLSGGDLILDNVLNLNKAEYNGEVFDKKDVNALDQTLMHRYDKTVDKVSDILLLTGMLTPAVFVSTDKQEWFTVATMYAETLLIANGIKELTKLCVNRIRPYMYFDSPLPQKDVESGDYANSFPSGHATMAFAAATFTSYTFSKYFPDTSWRYAFTAANYALATTVACMRIAAGCHFLTDVLTGAALGSAVGFLVPFVHTFNAKNSLNVGIAPNGVSFRVDF